MLRFHELRHTCVALLIAHGAHPKAIQERLGHSTIRVTFDRYGHLLPSLDAQLTEGLDEAFSKAAAASSRPVRGKSTVRHLPANPKGPPDLRFRLERTTGFEPATLTLAR